MILVPADAPGVEMVRPVPVFGADDAPHGHCEMRFTDVRVPLGNMLLGEGRGFEIAQGRLGPGRIHHCMRLIGMSERALALMCKRLSSRVAFGKPLATQGVWHERIAQSRILIDQAPPAHAQGGLDDGHGGQQGGQERDRHDQGGGAQRGLPGHRLGHPGHGGAGVSDVTPLAEFYGGARSLRLADGPDEVHRVTVAKNELGKYRV
jgi:acyl-CoA dehydrogenase